MYHSPEINSCHYNNGPLRQESNITIDPTLFNLKTYYHMLFGSDLRGTFYEYHVCFRFFMRTSTVASLPDTKYVILTTTFLPTTKDLFSLPFMRKNGTLLNKALSAFWIFFGGPNFSILDKKFPPHKNLMLLVFLMFC